MDLQRRFVALKNFLKRHEALLQSEVLNHYPNPLPPPYSEWIGQLQGLSVEELIQIECELDSSKLSAELADYFDELKELTHIPEASGDALPLAPGIERGMTLKKRHETERIRGFLADQAYNSFLDIGSGKGHLSLALLHDSEASSVCVDMDLALQKSGKKKIQKDCPQVIPKLRFVHSKFDKNMDFVPHDRSLVLGLHCCGDLSVEAMDFHLQSGGDLLSFGCCYHKLQRYNLSELSQKEPMRFSFHALNLAARANRKLTKEDYRRRLRVKRYRYALHMIMVDELENEFASLGNAHHTDYDLDFSEYCAKYAPETVGLDLDKIVKRYFSSEIFRSYLLSEAIRSPLGRALELYLLVDRALYLRENGKEISLQSFFDPSTSPRNIGLFSRSI